MVVLSALIFVPLIGALATLLFKSEKAIKVVALIATLIPLVLSLVLFAKFTPANTGINLNFQFVESYSLAEQLGMSYTVGVDGISMPLVVLTTLLLFLSVIFSWDVSFRTREYFILLLLMGVGVMGVFVSLDFFVLYVFWEIVLIPMYFLIGIWGGPKRDYAAIKFLIYTHLGSIVMLLALIAMYFQAYPMLGRYSFSMMDITRVAPHFQPALQILMFGALFFGFGVKFPIVPLHTWLPDAHVEAPTAGSVILAGLLLKMGGYGLIRVGVIMLPDGVRALLPLLMTIAVLSIIYGAVVCLAQRDLKKMVAFSSISHMGFVLMGISSLTLSGINGAVFQMFNHGLITAVLFMMCGVIHHHAFTRNIPSLHGLGNVMPKAVIILSIGFFASLGLPGLNGFVSEFMVFIGTYEAYKIWVLIPLLSVVVTGAYYLWTLQKLAFGTWNKELGKATDIAVYELVPLVVLTVLLFLFGLYPGLIIDVTNGAGMQVVQIFGGVLR